jgi:hypothetical protein
MRRWGAALASVSLAAIVALPTCPALAQSGPPAHAGAVRPLQRLIVVVPAAGTVEGAADPWTDPALVAARLRYADPGIPITLATPTDATPILSDPFWVTVSADPAAQAGAGVGGLPPIQVAVGVQLADALGTPALSLSFAEPGMPTAAREPGQATMVEVLGGPTTVAAYRVGDLVLSPDELRVPTWRLPAPGVDAVAIEGAWWSLTPGSAVAARAPSDPRVVALERRARRRLARSPVSALRRLIAVSVGDVTGDGDPEVALSFRRTFRPTYLNALRPRRAWVDAAGMSAHVGLYRPGDLAEVWVAGTLVRPVAGLEACDGALAVAYSGLHRPAVTRTTAWRWSGFGFLPLPELPGPGVPTCIDIDRDGRADAAILERSRP